MKIHPVGGEFFHADGLKDKLTVFAILRTRLQISSRKTLKKVFRQ